MATKLLDISFWQDTLDFAKTKKQDTIILFFVQDMELLLIPNSTSMLMLVKKIKSTLLVCIGLYTLQILQR